MGYETRLNTQDPEPVSSIEFSAHLGKVMTSQVFLQARASLGYEMGMLRLAIEICCRSAPCADSKIANAKDVRFSSHEIEICRMSDIDCYIGLVRRHLRLNWWRQPLFGSVVISRPD